MKAPKPGNPNPTGSDASIATVGVVIHTRHYRDAVISVFRGAGDLLVVDLGDGGPDTFPRAVQLAPDAIVLDLPEELLHSVTESLSRSVPRASLIAMNRLETAEALLPLFEGGITGFISRGASAEEILATVRDVLRGEFRCPPRLVVALARRLHEASHREIRPSGQPSLTPRQVQIVQLLETGLTNKQIAEKLGIEFSTVKNHVHRLLKKLDVQRRQEAAGRRRS